MCFSHCCILDYLFTYFYLYTEMHTFIINAINCINAMCMIDANLFAYFLKKINQCRFMISPSFLNKSLISLLVEFVESQQQFLKRVVFSFWFSSSCGRIKPFNLYNICISMRIFFVKPNFIISMIYQTFWN